MDNPDIEINFNPILKNITKMQHTNSYFQETHKYPLSICPSRHNSLQNSPAPPGLLYMIYFALQEKSQNAQQHCPSKHWCDNPKTWLKIPGIFYWKYIMHIKVIEYTLIYKFEIQYRNDAVKVSHIPCPINTYDLLIGQG